MKKEHDEIVSTKRKESHSKVWFIKSLELLKKRKITFKNVMDIGAGKGEFLELIRENFKIEGLFGIDYIDKNIKILKSKGIETFQIDLDNFEINKYTHLKNKFDLVICLETIEHVFNTDRLFSFFNLILKEGGYLLISTPNTESIGYKLFYFVRGYPYGENHHVRFFTYKKLNQYAFFNGFDFIKSNNYFSFEIDIIKRISRLRNEVMSKSISVLFFIIPYLLRKVYFFDYFVNGGLVCLFKKSQFPQLGLEIHNFKNNFSQLKGFEKNNWLNRIKRFYKKDKLNEHIYFKEHIIKLIERDTKKK